MSMAPCTRFLSREREFSSPPATTCCKRGEDPSFQSVFEYGLGKQHVAGLCQQAVPSTAFFATVLVRVDGNHHAMQRAPRILLTDQLVGRLEGSCQPAQPGQPSPHTTVCQSGPSSSQRMVLPVVINKEPTPVPNRSPVGQRRSEKAFRFVQYRLAHKLLESQGEREGSR